jgi:hypothetical protein
METEGVHRGRYTVDWAAIYEIREEEEASVEVQIRLSEAVDVNCSRYASEVVLTRVKITDGEVEAEADEAAPRQLRGCCCIPIPLFRLDETCVVKFKAYDTSFKDFVENAEAFLDNVEIIATAVQTPPAPVLAKTSALAKTSGQAFKPGIFRARTAQGFGELSGLAHNQLYLLEVGGMNGYICEGQFPQYLYICCERIVELVFRFHPCGKFPNRSLIFVRKECNGIRWENASLELQGRPMRTDGQGYLPIPRDMAGVATLAYPGRQFDPAVIDLNDASSVVTVVTVTEQAQILPSRSHQFVDDDGVPFSFRKLTALLPSGNSVQLMTDNHGRFEAPAGSVVYAEDDAFGLATEPIMVSTISEE